MGSANSRLPFGGDKSEGSAGPWIGRQPHLSPWCFPPAAHPCKQTWKIEQACGPNLVLKLNTPDGLKSHSRWIDGRPIHLVQRLLQSPARRRRITTMRSD